MPLAQVGPPPPRLADPDGGAVGGWLRGGRLRSGRLRGCALRPVAHPAASILVLLGAPPQRPQQSARKACGDETNFGGEAGGEIGGEIGAEIGIVHP
mmetsp:Transcript_9250/g.29281  ORF Transcript_9250/g.29281 Transcript_9250/m.29281 type:complete len:97 (-) Transcript_9250:83-373(-)